MAEEREPKWEGKASVEIASLKAEQVWPCLEDFCNLHNWIPTIDSCYQLEGVPGQPGLVRYCASTGTSSSNGTDEKSTTKWAKEKLLMIDPILRCLSYEVIDNNMGFKYYVATLKVLPINGGDGKDGCRIEWSFVADPVEGWRLEDLISYIDYCLQFMAKKMEKVFLQTGMGHHSMSIYDVTLFSYILPEIIFPLMAEETQPKWEGKAIARLKALKAEQVWPCLEDFCNVQKWFPNVDTCYQVEGVPGQPGLIRYCASTQTSSDDPNEKTRWAKEKLLTMDPIQRCFSYELIDNNVGFNSYSATVKVLPIDDDGNGCMIEWSFVADPIEGWRPDDLVSYIDSRLQFMAKKIEHALLQIQSV